MKRPQSAVTRMDETYSTVSKPLRPLSGVSDQTLRFHNSVEQLISKANYSLQLMNINESLQLYEQAFQKGEHQLSSIRLVKLLEDVVQQLVRMVLKSADQIVQQQILNRLLLWCQIQQSNEDIIHVKCPPLLQVKVMNACGDCLRKQNKFDESTNYLQMSLQILSTYRFESTIDDLLGQTYLLLSTNSLYVNHYASAITEAQSALQHLQQAAISGATQNEELHEAICDTYINMGIAKEHEKQFQEAHYNYYSSLIYSQQNLSDTKQMKIQQIYDQFLSRQAAYLQKIQYQSQKSQKSFNFSQNMLNTNKTFQPPFVELVKNSQGGKLSSNFFQKKQKIIKSLEKKRYNEEQAQMKFKPYMNKVQLVNSSQTTRIKLQQQRIPSPFKQPIVSNGVKIMKVNNSKTQTGQPRFPQGKQNTQSQNFLKQQQPLLQQSISNHQIQSGLQLKQFDQKQQQFQTPSLFIQYLERNLNDINSKVQLIQQYQNIYLPSIETSQGMQEIYSGQMSIHFFPQQNILYFKYLACQIVDQFNLNTSQKQIKLIGISLNISDINNHYSSVNQDPLSLKQFLLNFSVEYFRYTKVNLEKQCFQLPYTQANQFYFYIPEQNQNLLIQVKNDYESLVFLVDQSDDQKYLDQDIQPIFNQKSNSLASDDIQPLLYPQDKQVIDDDVQPVFEEQEEKLHTSQEYSQDFEPAPIMDSVPQDKYQKSSSLPQSSGGNKDNQYNGMEKFTIKIESEDQRQQVIEVYATDKKQQQESSQDQVEDIELNNAALLIQKRFREKRMKN